MIIFFIIVIAMVIFFEFKLNDGGWSFDWISTALLLGVFIGTFISAGVYVGLSYAFPKVCNLSQRLDLTTLRDNIGTKGDYFLGSGETETSLNYYYYEKMPDGGFQAGSVNMSQAEVYQDEQKHPYIQTYTIGYTNQALNSWIIPINWTCSDAIHIPKGSILQGYNLNLGR